MGVCAIFEKIAFVANNDNGHQVFSHPEDLSADFSDFLKGGAAVGRDDALSKFYVERLQRIRWKQE